MLDGVDVSAAAARVYRALLSDPAGSRAYLAASVGVAVAELPALIDQLVRAGLVQEHHPADDASADSVPRWWPLEPRAAVSAVVRSRQEMLDRALRWADDMAVEFADGMLRAQRTDLAKVIAGRQQVVTALVELTAAAQVDVAVLDAPPYVDQAASATAEQSLFDRGVRSRAVYATASIELPGRLRAIQQMVSLGEQARVLPSVPLKLVVVDGDRALLPLSVRDQQVDSAILVAPSMLARALHALFEALWAQAVPILPEGTTTGGEHDETDRELLVLLPTGMKDEAIARQLGISVRTLGRRITRLMAQLGASSRFQAGIQAYRRGWL